MPAPRCARAPARSLLADAQRLVLRRSAPGGDVLAVFNLSDTAADWPAEMAQHGTVLAAVNGAAPGILPAFGAILIEERN